MIFLLFINLVFSTVTDTCTANECTMVMHHDSNPSGTFTGASVAIKSKALAMQKDINVLVRDADEEETAREIKNTRIDITLKSKLKANGDISNSEIKELLLHLLEK